MGIGPEPFDNVDGQNIVGQLNFLCIPCMKMGFVFQFHRYFPSSLENVMIPAFEYLRANRHAIRILSIYGIVAEACFYEGRLNVVCAVACLLIN